MTSRERMCKTLNHEIPDCIPTFEYAIDQKVVDAICPGGEYADVVEKLDLDAVTAWEPSAGGYAKNVKRGQPGEVFIDEWGVKREWTSEMSAYPLEDETRIKSEADLVNFSPPDPLAEHRYTVLREYVQRFKGQKFITFMFGDMFDITKFLLGTQEFLIACIERPKLVKSIFDMATDWLIEVAKKAIDIGADMIIDAADVAFKNGPWIRPELMAEFHMPCLKRMAEAVKKRRAYIFNHTHGNIWSLLDMLVDTGIDVIHPLAPEGTMDIGVVKKIFGSKIVVAGNISTDLLSRASRAEVERVTRATIENARADGGYILMASSSIHSAVKPENYVAMVETCHTYGVYSS